jgi:hypothetical protein
VHISNSATDLLSLAERIWGYNPNPSMQTQGSRKGKSPDQGARRRFIFQLCDLERGVVKKVIYPDIRREAVHQVMETYDVSERRAYRVIGHPRTTQRYGKTV